MIGVGDLLADPSFRPYEDDDQPPTDGEPGRGRLRLDAAAMLDGLSDKQQEELLRAQEHFLELTTGYRSGDPDDALPGEPSPEYNLSLPLTQRVHHKADELGYSRAQMWRRLQRWREMGLWGLVDQRSLRPSDRWRGWIRG